MLYKIEMTIHTPSVIGKMDSVLTMAQACGYLAGCHADLEEVWRESNAGHNLQEFFQTRYKTLFADKKLEIKLQIEPPSDDHGKITITFWKDDDRYYPSTTVGQMTWEDQHIAVRIFATNPEQFSQRPSSTYCLNGAETKRSFFSLGGKIYYVLTDEMHEPFGTYRLLEGSQEIRTGTNLEIPITPQTQSFSPSEDLSNLPLLEPHQISRGVFVDITRVLREHRSGIRESRPRKGSSPSRFIENMKLAK